MATFELWRQAFQTTSIYVYALVLKSIWGHLGYNVLVY